MTVEEMINIMLSDDIVMVRTLSEDGYTMKCLYFGRKENLTDKTIKQSKVRHLSSCECTVTNAETGKESVDTTILLYI